MKRDSFLLVAALSLAVPLAAAAPVEAQPNADQVLTDMGLSGADRQKVLNGEFVTAELPSASDRDLSIAMAFLVKASPADLAKEAVAGEFIKADAQVQAHGDLSASSTVADLAGLQMTDDSAAAFADASAGSDLNLSKDEIAAFNAVKGGGKPAQQQQLQKMLLARFQAYQGKGLAGIAPYDRGGDSSDPAADLRRAADAAKGLKKYLPSLQQMLIGYPQATVAGAEQTFHWIQYDIDGKPTYVLTHGIAATDGNARVLTQRQYYVSTGYNAGQAVAAFLPVAEGTVVVYTNHTFTDQVAGFGGSMKRKIGRGMMESQLQKIFAKARTMAQ